MAFALLYNPYLQQPQTLAPVVERCRICGHQIAPNRHDIIYHHRLDMHTNKRTVEPVHAYCNYIASDTSGDIPEGHTRHEVKVMDPDTVMIHIENNMLILHGEEYVRDVMIMRNASCLYYKHMLQLDVSEDILEVMESFFTISSALKDVKK